MRAVWFLVAALPVAMLVPVWVRWATRHGVADAPGQRRLHAQPTPRGGGVVIALALVVGLATIGFADSTEPRLWWGLAAAIAWFGALGLLDDLAGLPARTKLVLQSLGVALLVAVLIAHWPGWSIATAVVLFVAALGFVNAWNFMDGSNGLVTVQSLLIGLAVAIWPGQSEAVQSAGFLLGAACLGFLPFNLPRARVFLGDSGSHVLGAAVFALLALGSRGEGPGLPQGLLLASALLLDPGFTLLQRWRLRRNLWRAHREHLYQYAIRRGHTHAAVCMVYAAWTLVAAIAALLLDRTQIGAWLALVVLAFCALPLHVGLKQYWLLRTRPDTQAGRA